LASLPLLTGLRPWSRS